MRRYRTQLTLIALLACSLLASCASRKVATDNPIRITSEEYDRVFESAVDVLRNEMFIVDRQDRRFGVITTEPLWSSSLQEPWRTDNTTFYQTLESSLNYHRRIVTITLTPQDSDAPTDQADATARPSDYQLEVAVAMQRRQHPDRALNTAAVSAVSFSSRSGAAQRLATERGDEQSFWRPMGRDQYLEQRLVNLILARASIVAPRHETQDPAPPLDDVPEIQ